MTPSGPAVAPTLESDQAVAPLPAAPVERAERITAIDTLRGFALLGILLMNIVAFGMHPSAYDDPTVTGGSTGANLAAWAVLHVLAEGKMRCLFSMVFGASMILLTTRLESRGTSGADIYYRRALWLLLFGLFDAYLLWLGDVLYPYALCALVLYPFRKLSARNLLIIGGVLLVLNGAAYIAIGFEQRDTIQNGRAAERDEAQGRKLTPEQQAAKQRYRQWLRMNHPTAAEIEKDNAEWRGNFIRVVKARAKFALPAHSVPYYASSNWDIWSMMFLGMALLKLGVLSAKSSRRAYALMAIAGFAIGLPLNSYTAWLIIRNHFDPALHEFANSTYDLGRLSIAMAYLGTWMLLSKSGSLRWLTGSLGAVGQMAFSNYVMQSVICTFLFTGYGFRLYGSLQRYQLYYVVAAIWMFQLIASPLWLRHFRFGPLEWCWRSLTYWKRQPMRLKSA